MRHVNKKVYIIIYLDIVIFIRNQGANLPVVSDAKSQGAMLWNRLISIGNKQIWLDGTVSNGSFIWNNEAKSLLSEGFTAWVAGQPDNFQNKEKCLMMNRLGRWIDVNCKSKGTKEI